MPYPHLIVEDIMPRINRRQKISQWLLSRGKKLSLFSWDNVPGKDNESLLRYLKDDHDIGWTEDAEITKSEDKTIHISKDKNSAEIKLDEEGGKATLKISNGRTHDLKVKKEDNQLNIYKKFTEWLPSREIEFTNWLLRLGIRKRFMFIFSLALIFGLIYGIIAYVTNGCCQKSCDIHFQMSADFAGHFLVEFIGYAVLIYGFFAAFLIYTISEIQKVSDEEYSDYRKVMSKVLNIFAVVTGFVVDFIFFSILSMYVLEKIKLNVVKPPVADFPIFTGAYLLFFMILIFLLGYLVFSLVVGLLNVRSEHA